MSLITEFIKDIVKKTQKAGKWQKTYLFISNDREKVVSSTFVWLCDSDFAASFVQGCKTRRSPQILSAQGELVYKKK